MPNKDGVIPLSLVAACGLDGTEKLLLGRDEVNPSLLDNNSQTLRSLTAENGKPGVAELLIECEGINLDIPLKAIRLHSPWLSRGHDKVVKLLHARIFTRPALLKLKPFPPQTPPSAAFPAPLCTHQYIPPAVSHPPNHFVLSFLGCTAVSRIPLFFLFPLFPSEFRSCPRQLCIWCGYTLLAVVRERSLYILFFCFLPSG